MYMKSAEHGGKSQSLKKRSAEKLNYEIFSCTQWMDLIIFQQVLLLIPLS